MRYILPRFILGACFCLGSLNVSAEESYQKDHVVVAYTGVSEAYVHSLARTAELARESAIAKFGFDMPEKIYIDIRLDPKQHVRLFTDGKDHIFLTIRSDKDLLKPSQSGIFHIYGICHEIAHMAMYRLIPNHDWLSPDGAQGWSHYFGSRLVDEVYAKEGDKLWPDKYNYLADGTARLQKQIAGENTNPGMKVWMELAAVVGDKGVAPIFKAWGKAVTDLSDPGPALYKAMVGINPDKRLEKWWETAVKILVLKQQRSTFGPKAVKGEDLSGKPIELAHDTGTSAGKKSIAGGGHAVRFEVQGKDWFLTEIRIYGSRYGMPAPPRENFHVWLCDSDFKVIVDFPFPYAKFGRGQPQWITLKVKPTSVPSKFIICAGFNPTGRKGVFVHRDGTPGKNSLVGLPGQSSEEMTQGNWMIRAKVDQLKMADGLTPGGIGNKRQSE